MNSKFIAILALVVQSVIADESCWSKALGLNCCTDPDTEVIITEKNGNKFGLENGQVCGIVEKGACPGYPNYSCCKKCDIKYTDDDSWGVEGDEWCSIPYSCFKESEKKSKKVCAKAEEPCGGSLYPDAPNCCEEGYYCYERSYYYSYCVKEEKDEVKDEKEQKKENKKKDKEEKKDKKGDQEKGDCPGYPDYSCCKKCDIKYTDDDSWGVEGDEWCSIPYSCFKESEKKSKKVCAKAEEPCGGSLYPDAPNCCEKGYYCYKRSEFYSYCVKK